MLFSRYVQLVSVGDSTDLWYSYFYMKYMLMIVVRVSKTR